MLIKRPYQTLILICVLALLAGCKGGRLESGAAQAGRIIIPPGVAGTVGHYADLVGGEPLPLRGYGLVVGLGKAGSSEVPPHIRKVLIQQMLRHKVSSPMAGTAGLTPARMLADQDTAVVVVTGRLPPAAPPKKHFDLYVEALPGTQTVSLDGGVLMSAELHLALGGVAGTARKVKTWAIGRGAVFVNPFIDRAKAAEKAKLRTGRIPGGAVVVAKRMLRLELRDPDYRVANVIERRINQRFGRGVAKVARAKGPSIIDLDIPPAFQDDYEHFLQLVMHIYLPGGPEGQDRYARQLARAIELPTARHEDICLVWEAMGRQVLSVIQPLYASENSAAAFHAARAGLRQGDPLATEPMIRAANQANAPFQVPAVRELGRARKFIQGVGVLKRLLTGGNQLLRVAAYEALVDRGSASAIRRENISRQFLLDVVQTDGDYVIYVTRTGRPKIVLFGGNIPIRRPIFYCPPDELVTINAHRNDKKIGVYRKIPGTGRMSDTFQVSPRVDALVRTLGKLPEAGRDGRPEGLGLTYSQVVGVLYALCKKDHIPAKFVLQQAPGMRRIYASTPAVGRPDSPGDDGP